MTDAHDHPIDATDHRILDEIAAHFDETDPVPAHLADDVVFALSLAALDAEIAAIQESTELSLRSHPPTRTDSITFSSSALQLMVSTSDETGDGIRIDGWVTGGGITVELIQGSRSIPAVSDAHGRLVWRDVARGHVRFLLHPPGGRPVLTPQIEL